MRLKSVVMTVETVVKAQPNYSQGCVGMLEFKVLGTSNGMNGFFVCHFGSFASLRDKQYEGFFFSQWMRFFGCASK